MNKTTFTLPRSTGKKNTTYMDRTVPVIACGVAGANEIFTYTYTIIVILLAIISTVENTLVMIVICKYKSLRKSSVLLLGVLAAIGFLIGSVIAPINVTITLDHNDLLFHTFWWMTTAAVFLSLSTVVLVTLDCLFFVYFLHNYKLSKIALCCGLLISWIVPLVLSFVIAYRFIIGERGAVFVLAYSVMCILTMAVLYFGISIVLRSRESSNNRESHERVVATSLVIVITFVVMNILPIISIALSSMRIYSRALCAFTFLIMLTNSALNPLIYCLRIPSMRKHIFHLLQFETLIIRKQNTEEDEDMTFTEEDGRTRDIVLYVIPDPI